MWNTFACQYVLNVSIWVFYLELFFFLYKCFYKKTGTSQKKWHSFDLINGINDATVTWNERELKREDVISPTSMYWNKNWQLCRVDHNKRMSKPDKLVMWPCDLFIRGHTMSKSQEDGLNANWHWTWSDSWVRELSLGRLWKWVLCSGQYNVGYVHSKL